MFFTYLVVLNILQLVYYMSQKVQLHVRGSGFYRIKLRPNPGGTSDLSKRKSFSSEMSQKECCDNKKTCCNFLILNDSTCQFYYKVNTCV